MLKLGVLLCAYDCEDLLAKCLSPWINYNDNQNKIIISAVSTQFEDFEFANNLKTLEILDKYKSENKIDSIFISNIPLKEHAARNLSLNRLLKLKCDVVLIWDSDEIISKEDIGNLFNFLENDKNSANIWYRINYKNLTFDNNHYTLGFDPARLFWTNKDNYELQYLFYDNDCLFYYLGDIISYLNLPFKHVPNCMPVHHSWNNLERSKKKIDYQIKHFGHGNSNYCSFKFNQEKNCIEFNDEYFLLTGENKPDIFEF